jgi:isoleucyl-tRNA synthetase
VTAELEVYRKSGEIGSSLQAAPRLVLRAEDGRLLTPEQWAEVCIVSRAEVVAGGAETLIDAATVRFGLARGNKCARCWRVLEEVGDPARPTEHPELCFRCEAVVEGQERSPPAAAA